MGGLIMGVYWLANIISLVCLVLVIIKIFQSGQTGLGIACAVLSLCGIGALITFVVGWINASKWGINNIMLAWTIAIVVGIASSFAMPQPIWVIHAQ
jgi:hypothetical protein